MEERIHNQIDMMLEDLKNEKSDLYNFVFRYSGESEDEFAKKMCNEIKRVNTSSYYGDQGDTFAAYSSDGKEYFKFTAPMSEMESAVGADAPFLQMYRGGVYLSDLSPAVLEKYVMPLFYRAVYQNNPSLKNKDIFKDWHLFYVSLD